MLLSLAALLATLCPWARADGQKSKPPYPPSTAIGRLIWHWDSLQTAAPGSDLWPVTWAKDDNLYLAWGDGGALAAATKTAASPWASHESKVRRNGSSASM
ncbi:MAG: hypothetical protein JWO87_2634 [Phycisphaerales bacterium]|nr:hypothetical protein [Phycisphaerales bacterium]